MLEHKSSININMSSVHNLVYKKPPAYHDKDKFAAMMERAKLNKPLFNNQQDVKQTLTDFLIPQNKQLKEKGSNIHKTKTQSWAKHAEQRSKQQYLQNNKLQALDGNQKIELMNFYNDGLNQLKLTRREVVKTKANESRIQKLKY